MGQCETCVYCVEGEIDADNLKRQFYCRRNPPTTQAIPTSQGIINVVSFPSVTSEMGCGEHKEDAKIIN